MARGRLLLVVMASVVAACAAPEAQSPTPAPVQSATPTPAPPAPPPAIRVAPFDDAVVAAADTLFSQVHLAPGERKLLVIDPLVDGVSGMQSAATVLMGSRIAGMVRSQVSAVRTAAAHRLRHRAVASRSGGHFHRDQPEERSAEGA